MNRLSLLAFAFFFTFSLAHGQEFLIKLTSHSPEAISRFTEKHGGSLKLVSDEGLVYKWTTSRREMPPQGFDSTVVVIEPNRPIFLPENPSIQQHRAEILKALTQGTLKTSELMDDLLYPDNPEMKTPSVQAMGSDPLLEKAWGIKNVGIDVAWQKIPQGKGIVVAVTDTGIDYNHDDLINNLWRNKGEIAGNGKDDDGNGYIDDTIGWDFFSDDAKPYDAMVKLMDLLTKGGNPGHGTHVSGVIAATMNNSLGTAGVAPQAQIMALRFINEEGKGSTEAAIKAIDYAVKNGAHIINASWGGEKDEEDDTLLKEALQRAEKRGVLFMVAAGNGRVQAGGQKAEGFDNDSDAKPIVPANYDFPNMVSVSAIDEDLKLASFSNWGKKSCKIGAPGVRVLSTVPGNRYQDTVVDIGFIKATWDGTSMATPYVAGAAAAIWSQDINQTASVVRERVLEMAVKISALQGKVSTDGRLDLHNVK